MMKYKFIYNGQTKLPEVSGIYAIVNTLNNKKYVGSSSNIRKRYRQHYNELSKNNHVNTHLQRAFNKYGKDVFEFWILEQCEDIRDTLLTIEQKWIDSDGDYNICRVAGSTLGIPHQGHPASEKCKKAVAEANRRRVWSDESRKKMAEYSRNSKHNAEQRKAVIQLDLNGNYIKEFPSIIEAANELGAENKRVNIKRCCQGKRKTAYGFKWIFKNGNKINISKNCDS